MIGLGTVEAATRVHGVEATPGSPAMVLVVWADDVDKACADLAAAGVPVLQPPHVVALVRDDPEFWGLMEQLRDLAMHVVSLQDLDHGNGRATAP